MTSLDFGNQPTIEDHHLAESDSTEIQEEVNDILITQEFVRMRKRVMYGENGTEFTYDTFYGTVEMPEVGKEITRNSILQQKEKSKITTENGRVIRHTSSSVKPTMEIYAKATDGYLQEDTAGVIHVVGRPVAKVVPEKLTGEFILEEKPMIASIEAKIKIKKLINTDTEEIIEEKRVPIIPDDNEVEIMSVGEDTTQE